MPLILFNKPFQVLCHFPAHPTRPPLPDHRDIPTVYPAARLYADGDGLLLLTEADRTPDHISQPLQNLPNTYPVQR